MKAGATAPAIPESVIDGNNRVLDRSMKAGATAPAIPRLSGPPHRWPDPLNEGGGNCPRNPWCPAVVASAQLSAQ